ncbi:3-hydroxylacyl-ACP dehydratase [Treponema sp.]|uniref:ApeP family dehydratase n=1 Tax=Treponema sp. TaxID=166 RepID=UPI0025E0EC52|nr:3-hydroxylacyl-ACP dehydratase [Treponema sp.]MCR5218039.1 3-hydroxylacyl-ACP dehydratase [Treponema sp.]
MADNILPQQMDRTMIEKLLPHKGKMFLQDRITSYDPDNNIITTEFDVKKDCIFYDKDAGGIPSWAAFEIMAQGISALASIKRILRNDTTPPKSGMVLSVTDFTAPVSLFKEGQTLYMNISEDCCVGNVYKYLCILYLDKEDSAPGIKTYISVMEVDDIKGVLENNE